MAMITSPNSSTTMVVASERGTRRRCAASTSGVPRYARMAPIRNGVITEFSQRSAKNTMSAAPTPHK